ncbi:MAG: MFS transporter, partial [Pseudoclavibacter sp.]
VPQPRGFSPPRRGEITFARQVRDTLGHVGAHARRAPLIGVYAQPLLLMGGFVAMYNFLGFRLLADPYRIPSGLVGLMFLAYLAGSIASPYAGALAARFPRKYVLLACTLIMLGGTAMTMSSSIWLIVTGLVVMTAGFFAAHSVASGIAGSIPTRGRAQSSAIYNFQYYLGSSVFGFVGGVLYVAFGWIGTVTMVGGLTLLAMVFTLVLIPAVPPPGAAKFSPERENVGTTTGPTATP